MSDILEDYDLAPDFQVKIDQVENGCYSVEMYQNTFSASLRVILGHIPSVSIEQYDDNPIDLADTRLFLNTLQSELIDELYENDVE
jgi:hypothetical protein